MKTKQRPETAPRVAPPTTNHQQHTECRQCGRPLSLEQQVEQEDKQSVLERLAELEEKGVLEKLEQLDDLSST